MIYDRLKTLIEADYVAGTVISLEIFEDCCPQRFLSSWKYNDINKL